MVTRGAGEFHWWEHPLPPMTPGHGMAQSPTHKRTTEPFDADGRPQVNAFLALVVIAGVVVLLLATSALSERLVG